MWHAKMGIKDWTITLAATLAIALAGCGGSSGDDGGTANSSSSASDSSSSENSSSEDQPGSDAEALADVAP